VRRAGGILFTVGEIVGGKRILPAHRMDAEVLLFGKDRAVHCQRKTVIVDTLDESDFKELAHDFETTYRFGGILTRKPIDEINVYHDTCLVERGDDTHCFGERNSFTHNGEHTVGHALESTSGGNAARRRKKATGFSSSNPFSKRMLPHHVRDMRCFATSSAKRRMSIGGSASSTK